ncbi:hypothetical protein K449DRAFT_430703 [Hypoxylon sp. EC38]|nr:hypothetical protein K449DRAFT_430703 [Hypoxylon sp. EC38]
MVLAAFKERKTSGNGATDGDNDEDNKRHPNTVLSMSLARCSLMIGLYVYGTPGQRDNAQPKRNEQHQPVEHCRPFTARQGPKFSAILSVRRS